MHAISALAKCFGLSRSALLYYDRIGLLRPSGRSACGYRLYSDEDKARLQQICLFRQAGVPLEGIAQLLAPDAQEKDSKPTAHVALMTHLQDLSMQIQALQTQQAQVVKLLFSLPTRQDTTAVLDRRQLTDLLLAAGVSQTEMRRLHIQFEHSNPQEHARFLAALGMRAEEIAALRTQVQQAISQAARYGSDAS
jgi:DNA-binding transcriptional MerR regulator